MCADTPLDDVRELWSSQVTGVFRLSPEEVHARMERYSRRSRRAAFDVFLASAVNIAGFIAFMVLFHNPLLRAGAILIIVSGGFLAWETRSSRMAEKEAARLAAESGIDAVAFHRQQLRRQQQRHAGFRFWRRWFIILPGPIVFFLGFAQARPDLSGIIWVEFTTAIIAILAAIPLNRRAVRQCQRRIDGLDRLRKEIS